MSVRISTTPLDQISKKQTTSGKPTYRGTGDSHENDLHSSYTTFTLPIGNVSDYSHYNSDTPRTATSETSQVSTITSDVSDYMSYNNNSNNNYANMNKSLSKGGQKRGASVATVGPIVHPVKQSYDTSDYILDKIDYEFYNMARKTMTSKKKKRKPGKKDRAVLKSQGVEFDTGDETSGAELRHVLVLNDGYKQALHGMSLDLSGDGNDTGLGTASIAEGSDLENSDPKQILGRADVYSEAEDKQNHMYLDSDVAKQLDAQYKQILKKKSAEFIQDLAQKSSFSDLSSVLTEDLVTKYKQYMVKSISECSFPTKPGRPLVYNQHNHHNHKGKDVQMSDLDSIKTEDIEGEFRKTMVKPALSDISHSSKLKSQKFRSKAAKSTKIPKFTANPLKTKKRKGQKGFGMSDAESVRTEDFENSFHKVMVKQIGGVPITSFDQMMVDSDLDTIKSHVIREKLRAALAANNPEEEEETNDSEEYSSDESEKFDTVIDTHKLQELLKETNTTSMNGDHRVSLESMEVMQGSPRKDYSFPQETSPSKYLTTSEHQSQYSFQKVQHSIPPPLWEKDENTYINNCETSETDHETTTNSSSVSTYSKKLCDKQNNRVPLRKNKYNHIRSNMNSDSSLSTDAVSETASSSHEENSLNMNGGINLRDIVPQCNESEDTNSSRTRRQKPLSCSSTSKSESSCFEEVESIDFDMQHDINLADLTRALKGLSEKERGEFNSSSSRSYLRRKRSERNLHSLEAQNGHGQADFDKKRRSRVLVEDSEEEEDVKIFPCSKQIKRKHLGKLDRRESSSDVIVNTPEWVLKNVFRSLENARIATQLSTDSNMSSSFSARSSFSSSRGSFSINPYASFVSDCVDVPESGEVNAIEEEEEDKKSTNTAMLNGVSNGYPSMPMDTSHQLYRHFPQAEDMLMNLGFGGIGSFLPERFAKDWYKKIMQAKKECVQQFSTVTVQQNNVQQDVYPVLSTVQQDTVPVVNNGHRSKILVKNLSSQNKVKRHTSNFLHKLDINSRTNADIRRSRWRRAVSAISCGSAIAETLNLLQSKSNEVSVDNTIDESPVYNGETEIQKQDSLDQLKSVLERQAQILHLGSKKGEKRRQQFVNTRQQSLPLFLETLSEEDESRLSRGPSLEKPRKKVQSLSSDEELGNSSVHNHLCKQNFKIPSDEHPCDITKVHMTLSSNDESRDGDFIVNDSDGLNSSYASSFSEKSVTGLSMFKSASVGSSLSLLSEHSSLSPVNRSTSLASSFDLEIECPTDTECDSITGEFNRRKNNDSSPILNDTISLGQTGFSAMNELNPSPMSPRWYNSDMEDNNDEFGDKPSPCSTSPANVPDITVTRTSSPGRLCSQSSASLEVEEILHSSKPGSEKHFNKHDENGLKGKNNGTLDVVPAMVSVVLSDVEDKHSVIKYNEDGLPTIRHRPLTATLSDSEDHLRAPSPSASILSSPVPLSPITVIEMDHLDNQNDSIDSGDGSSGDHNLKFINKDDNGSNLMQNNLTIDSLQPISEASDEGGMSTDISRDPSFEEVNFDRVSNNSFSIDNSEIGIEADDGKLSPIYLLGREDETRYSSISHTTVFSGEKQSNQMYENLRNANERNILSEYEESSMQTDEQLLSPIMFQCPSEKGSYSSSDFYIVCDKDTQCGNSLNMSMLDKVTQTDCDVECLIATSVAKQDKCVFTSEQNIWDYNRSISDFEPQYLLTTGCQTDKYATDEKHASMSFIHPDIVKLKELLCNDCRKFICQQLCGSSPEDLVTETQSIQSDCLSPINVSNTNVIRNKENNLDKENSSSKSSIENLLSLKEICSPTRQKSKFSPKLLVQKMLDQSIKMTNYIEKNVSLTDSFTFDVENSFGEECDVNQTIMINGRFCDNSKSDETLLKEQHCNDFEYGIQFGGNDMATESISNNKYKINEKFDSHITEKMEINHIEMSVNKVVDIGVTGYDTAVDCESETTSGDVCMSDKRKEISNKMYVSEFDKLPKQSSCHTSNVSDQEQQVDRCRLNLDTSVQFLEVPKLNHKKTIRKCFSETPYNSCDVKHLQNGMHNATHSDLSSCKTPVNSIDIAESMFVQDNSVLSVLHDTGEILNQTTETDVNYLEESAKISERAERHQLNIDCLMDKRDQEIYKRKLCRNYKIGRKLKTFEKVDSWLEKSLSCSSDTVSCAGETSQPSRSENPINKQLDWERNVLKSMSNQSQRWMDYFDNMDNNRLKMVPTHPFNLDLNQGSMEEFSKNTDSKTAQENSEVFIENQKSSPTLENGKIFDLNNLLSRIDRIESLIKTVTTTYNASTMNFDEVSKQLSGDNSESNGNSEILQVNEQSRKSKYKQKMAKKRIKRSATERQYKHRFQTDTIIQNQDMEIISPPEEYAEENNILCISSEHKHISDDNIDINDMTIGYSENNDRSLGINSDLHDICSLNTLPNIIRPPLTPTNTLDIHDNSNMVCRNEDKFAPSAFTVVHRRTNGTPVRAEDSKNEFLALKLQEIENEIIRANELEKMTRNSEGDNQPRLPEFLKYQGIKPNENSNVWFHPIPYINNQEEIRFSPVKSNCIGSPKPNLLPMTPILISNTASSSTSLSAVCGSDDDQLFPNAEGEILKENENQKLSNLIPNEEIKSSNLDENHIEILKSPDEAFSHEHGEMIIDSSECIENALFDENEYVFTNNSDACHEGTNHSLKYTSDKFGSPTNKHVNENVENVYHANISCEENSSDQHKVTLTGTENLENNEEFNANNMDIIEQQESFGSDSESKNMEVHEKSENKEDKLGDLNSNLAPYESIYNDVSENTVQPDIEYINENELFSPQLLEKFQKQYEESLKSGQNSLLNCDEFSEFQDDLNLNQELNKELSSMGERFLHAHSLCDFDTNISEEYYDRCCMEHRDSLSKLSFSTDREEKNRQQRYEYGIKQKAYSIDYGSMTAKERRRSFGHGNEAFDSY